MGGSTLAAKAARVQEAAITEVQGRSLSGDVNPYQHGEFPDHSPLYQNQYEHCGSSWTDVWDCGVDDDCPNCGVSCSPVESDQIRKEGCVVLFTQGSQELKAYLCRADSEAEALEQLQSEVGGSAHVVGVVMGSLDARQSYEEHFVVAPARIKDPGQTARARREGPATDAACAVRGGRPAQSVSAYRDDLLQRLAEAESMICDMQSVINRRRLELNADWRPEWRPTPDDVLARAGGVRARMGNAISDAGGELVDEDEAQAAQGRGR